MRGGDTRTLRAFNERQILQAIRSRGPLSKADLARATGLSAQAASVIVESLIADGLLAKGEKVRGRVGQPHTPLTLAPDGAYALGAKIGRRSVEVVLIDFLGRPLRRWSAAHPAPLREETMSRALEGVRAVMRRAPRGARERLVGLGVATPGQIDLWAEELGLSPEALADWRGFDPARMLAAATGLEASLYNDCTAACAAELAVGGAVTSRNTLYVYVGSFIGGGVVVEGELQYGSRSNAGAIGSMPVGSLDARGRPRQLIHEASLVTLERALAADGLEPRPFISGESEAPPAERRFGDWLDHAAPAVARAVAAAASVIEFESVVLDGVLNPRWRSRVLSAVEAAYAGLNTAGLSPLRFTAGTLGWDARVLGAALLPLHARFSPQPAMLVGDQGRRPLAAE